MSTKASLALCVVISFGACTASSIENSAMCTRADKILATCGRTAEQSPFGTCQPEQAALAKRVVDLYNTDGCTGFIDGKADSATCQALPFLCREHSIDELPPFTTDGCSMFPDGTFSNPTQWLGCCINHDFAYYIGGRQEARLAADDELHECITEVAHWTLADAMWVGVRIGGTPALPTPWRWGYGWSYDPFNGYRTLSVDEAYAAHTMVNVYRADPNAVQPLDYRLPALEDDIEKVPDLEEAMAEVDETIDELYE